MAGCGHTTGSGVGNVSHEQEKKGGWRNLLSVFPSGTVHKRLKDGRETAWRLVTNCSLVFRISAVTKACGAGFLALDLVSSRLGVDEIG